MRLELQRKRIERIQFGERTMVQGRTLFINKERLIREAAAGSGLELEVLICRPGDRVRITSILDILEPRAKPGGRPGIFPGFLGPSKGIGEGATRVLEGVAVMEVADMPRVQYGLVDMAGNGARYSPFSMTNNIVLVFDRPASGDLVRFERAVRLAALRAAVFLAGASINEPADKTEVFDLFIERAQPKETEALKRIAYIYMLQSQGFLRDTFLYGRSASGLTARAIHPNETMDGAIVSGNYVIPANRNSTYFHLNNPVIRELYTRHGVDLLFDTVVICNEQSSLEGKRRAATEAARILKRSGVDGAVITKEGGGNADTDLILACRACESEGIRTVLIGNESAGPDGTDPSLAHTDPLADAFVTTGNNDEKVELDPVEMLVGKGQVQGIAGDPMGSLHIPVCRIHGSTALLGHGLLSCRSY